jgi:S-adenosylmethionine decarboxylase
LYKGKHLLIDCCGVPRDVCLNDELVLDAMARAARRAGAKVLSQVRYHLGHNSPPGFAIAVLLDESHCTAHSYADLGLMAFDVFTCGDTSPYDVLQYIQEEVDLGEVAVTEFSRFPIERIAPAAAAASGGNGQGDGDTFDA